MKNVGFGTNCNSPWAKTFDFTGFPQTRTIDSTRRSGRLIRVESLASHAKWCLADIEQHLARESFEQPKHSQTILGHTASRNLREKANVTRRWHDNRHTLITELAESGAGDQTIMDIAGHVSKQMVKHYSHIRMEAKRTALESIVKKQTDTGSSGQQTDQAEGALQKSLHELQNGATRQTSNHATGQPANSTTAKKTEQKCSELPVNTQHFEGESLQKSLQSCNFEGHRGVVKPRKSKNLFGSSGRTRTYNPSVNSRTLPY